MGYFSRWFFVTDLLLDGFFGGNYLLAQLKQRIKAESKFGCCFFAY